MLEEDRSPVHDVVNSGGGSPLAPDVRDEMQGRLGHDFCDVRVHTDSAAHESAKSVNAHAYTVGSNVVFQRDKYDPASVEGKTMLAHELTHVVQQRSGPVDGTVGRRRDQGQRPVGPVRARGVRQRRPGDVRARPPRPRSSLGRRPAVQRHEAEEDDAQGSFVQREEAPEEEEETAQGSFVQREAEEEEAPEEA